MSDTAPMRAALDRFVELFDAGEPWEAHEVLEAPWRRSGDETARGLIQVAAVQVHLDAGRWSGAARVLTRAIAHLEAGPSVWHGFDVNGLRAELEAWARWLDSGRDPDGMPVRLALTPFVRLGAG